ncbi:hypothetical protein [Granulosicoccus antarcticus]|uniref:hypothetical protein n=1 Tax=Granulosicoccus antarcticus TaxID=437505 RepID=UPI000B5A6CB5|nr:hypothetical protein [Granulosicoccus antarcticus]
MAALLLILLLGQLAVNYRKGKLQLSHFSEGWIMRHTHSASSHSGVLVQAGYRSAWLIIAVIQSEDSCLHRVAIWQDQLTARQFSYLHQQLAFAAEPPVRRTPRAWLNDLIS